MDKIRCIVVDDEPLAVKMLENFIERTPFLVPEASFSDPVTALTEIQSRKPHLVFLDIQMPDLDGMELSRMVPKETRIIFTTAFKQYAFESYEVEALDFLLKPIRYQKFLEAATKAKEWFELKEAAANNSSAAGMKNTIFVKADGALHKINLGDILYVEGMKDYVSIWLTTQKHPLVTHLTMKAAEDLLPRSSFMRVHRSYIVALDKISSVSSSNDIEIGTGLIHVSEAYKEDFEAFLEANSFSK